MDPWASEPADFLSSEVRDKTGLGTKLLFFHQIEYNREPLTNTSRAGQLLPLHSDSEKQIPDEILDGTHPFETSVSIISKLHFDEQPSIILNPQHMSENSVSIPTKGKLPFL